MDRLAVVALTGGFFAILTFIHFFVDWIFQSHAEAMVKHNNPKIRAKHCAIYTSPFVLFLWWCGLSPVMIGLAAVILFFSHFVEDTYLPVYLWAKYIRKPPEMATDPENGFIQFISTPLGKILMIAIDQVIHITFLLPIAYMIVIK